MTFAFYDLETTGTSPAFDQPLQFAAILTDDALREIEHVNLRCRIAPHVIPSPWALAVTGVRPAQLLDPALPTFFELAQQIGALTCAANRRADQALVSRDLDRIQQHPLR